MALDIRALLGEGRKAREPWTDSQVSRNSQQGWALPFRGWSRPVLSSFLQDLSRGPALETTCPLLARPEVCPAALWEEPADLG